MAIAFSFTVVGLAASCQSPDRSKTSDPDHATDAAPAFDLADAAPLDAAPDVDLFTPNPDLRPSLDAGIDATIDAASPDLAVGERDGGLDSGSTPPDGDTIPATLFGLHMKRADTTTAWPTAPFGTWRLWDAHVFWKDLEPSRGNWSWTALDRYAQLAGAHGVELVMTLGLTPKWASARPNESSAYGPGNAAEPANLDDWRDFVTTVATRYKGKISYYEIWNETNLKEFYTGSVDAMVQMTQVAYAALKAVDPSIQVLCPSTTEGNTSWLDSFLSKGGKGHFDIVAYHPYTWPAPPEQMVPILQSVKALMAKHDIAGLQLWSTEAGWLIANQQSTVSGSGVLDPTTAAAYVVRTFALNWAGGASRFFWYGWDDPRMGLTDADGVTVKQPGRAYATTYRWLVGARLDGCSADSTNVWVCPMQKANGKRAWLVWNPKSTTAWALPEGASSYQRLVDGDAVSASLAGQSQVSVGPMPILVE